MYSHELLKLLRSLNKIHKKKYATGIFAADMLPLKFKTPAAFIVNTHDHSKRGEHWVAIYIPKKGIINYFDSYGLPPLIDNHVLFLSTHANKITHNKKELQSLSSKFCGEYCLLYLSTRMNGKSLRNFHSLFTSNMNNNDRLVPLYMKTLKNHIKLSLNTKKK